MQPAALSQEDWKRLVTQLKHGEATWRTLEEEREGFRDLARELLGGEAATEADVARLGDRLSRYYDIYEMVPGIRELLDELAARRIPMAMVSEWPPSPREFMAHHDLLRYFKTVVGTAYEGVLKPHPQLIHRALGLPTVQFCPKRTYPADCYETAELRILLKGMIA